MYDILILGGGPAGLSAAIYGARAGRKVAVMEKTAAGGQIVSTHRLENYPGFAQGISGPEFSENLRQQAAMRTHSPCGAGIRHSTFSQ